MRHKLDRLGRMNAAPDTHATVPAGDRNQAVKDTLTGTLDRHAEQADGTVGVDPDNGLKP